MNGERLLWQHVIYKAFIDATALDPTCPKNSVEKMRADRWIRDCGRDFRDVCYMAGFDPDFLSDAYKAGRVDPDMLRGDEKIRERHKRERRRNARMAHA